MQHEAVLTQSCRGLKAKQDNCRDSLSVTTDTPQLGTSSQVPHLHGGVLTDTNIHTTPNCAYNNSLNTRLLTITVV